MQSARADAILRAMDAVSHELRAIHVDQVRVESLELRGTWGAYVPMPSPPASLVVVVIAGELWLEAYGRPDRPMRWTSGDVGLLLPGYRFVARSSPSVEPRRPEDFYPRIDRDRPILRWGTGGQLTRFTVLGCSMSQEALAPLVGVLSPVSRISTQGVWGSTLRTTLDRHAAGRPGAHAALERMAEFVLVEGVSVAIERSGPGPASAIDDPRIARALALIQSELGRAWTAESLARRVGMSRTAFFNRFAALVGQSPIRYLTERRLERAEELLTTTPWSLADIARRVGYGEGAALCRAFKRMHGVSPGAVRRGAGCLPPGRSEPL